MSHSWKYIAFLLPLLLAACGGDDGGGNDGGGNDGSADDDSTDGQSTEWSLLASDQRAALLSVWGSSSSDVWVVGGDNRDDLGPIITHYDGSAWTAMDPGVRNVDLFWVFGFAGGPVYFGGTNGTILRYQDGSFEQMETPGSGVVFGIWGAWPEDVWAVGGGFGGGGGGFVWRLQDGAWVDVAEVPDDVKTSGTSFKVAGRSGDDVWISCSSGTMLHWDGAALGREDVAEAADDPLFSVSCSADRCVAVGGTTVGGIYEDTGDGWAANASGQDGPVWRGVSMSDAGGEVVGLVGTMLSDDGGEWSADPQELSTENMHAVWVDPDGGVWAVGGKFDQPMTKDGVLLFRGPDAPPAIP
jgi:hypothetical protein